MTIPSLITKNDEKTKIVQLKKAYNVLLNAVSLTVAQYGVIESWGWEDNQDSGGNAVAGSGSLKIMNLLSQNLNVMKNCGTDKGCFKKGGDYKCLNGASLGVIDDWRSSKAVFADGMQIVVGSNGKCDQVVGTSEASKNLCGWVYVDTNGENGPNVMGKDYFGFRIGKMGLIPMGTPDVTLAGHTVETGCKLSACGYPCTAWVLLKENMDYLRKSVTWK